ncbi:hypothetical protein J4447_03230 [Candidatus Pacearchaeota archaeon]|nr:hypothetical protein [Candidatus Pacearchaeota archaeon]
MKIRELHKKYGRNVIDKLLSQGKLNGNTFISDNNGKIIDIPEDDVIRAIREERGEEVSDWD